MALTQIACWLSHACFCWGTRKLWSQSSHPDWQLRLTWPKMLGLDASAVCPSPNSTTTSTADANDLLLAAGDRYNELIYRTGTACVTCSWRAASSLTSFIALFSAHHEYLYKPSVPADPLPGLQCQGTIGSASITIEFRTFTFANPSSSRVFPSIFPPTNWWTQATLLCATRKLHTK